MGSGQMIKRKSEDEVESVNKKKKPSAVQIGDTVNEGDREAKKKRSKTEAMAMDVNDSSAGAEREESRNPRTNAEVKVPEGKRKSLHSVSSTPLAGAEKRPNDTAASALVAKGIRTAKELRLEGADHIAGTTNSSKKWKAPGTPTHISVEAHTPLPPTSLPKKIKESTERAGASEKSTEKVAKKKQRDKPDVSVGPTTPSAKTIKGAEDGGKADVLSAGKKNKKHKRGADSE